MEHQEGHIIGYGGIRLYYQCWLPATTPRATLLICHGLAEHSGRYMDLASYFVPKGYAAFGLDHRGHGRSAGRRCYIDRFDHYLYDFKTFSDIVRERQPGSPFFLIGHSMGGTIAAAYALEHQSDLAGLVLSGVTLSAGTSVPPVAILMARLLSVLLPGMGVATLDASAISKDQSVVTAYVNDPLVWRGKIPARTGAEFLRIMRLLPGQLPRLKLPVLVLHGKADRLSSPGSSQTLYERLGSSDTALRLYEGLYHEVFNEPERAQVLADVASWLDGHSPGTG
ncbi:MAG: lysophospholipase [Chloroflexi bacterium]|nr:lysophospholipase [Chloroflexota bacterium]